MAVAEQTRFSFPIFKFDTTPDGDVVVYGKCTDDTIDADQQIVDSKWSGKALDEWFAKAANVRVQHSPFLYPAGKGMALEIDRDGDGAHWLKALVVEPTAKTLVQKGILQDFSIGILNPRVVNHHRAFGGKICGGEIGEVSLCDRGSNKNSRFTIAKSASGGDIELIAKFTGVSPLAMPHRVINKGGSTRIVDSAGNDRSSVPAADFAGPDHTYPIEHQDDVPSAASLAHHADNPAQVRQRIRAIANRKWPDMTMPPSLADKADTDEDTKPCVKCHTMNPASASKCDKCGTRLGMTVKADAAQDGTNVSDDDSDDEDAAASSAGKPGKKKPSDPDDDDDDAPKALFTKKPGKKKPKKPNPFAAGGPLADKAARTPASTSSVDGKPGMKPAGTHREPDGAVVEPGESDAGMPTDHEGGDPDGVPGSDFGTRKKGRKNKSAAPLSLRRLHDATCPALSWKSVRKGYGIGAVTDALPMRELQSNVAAAIGAGATKAADEFLGLVKAAEQLQQVPPDVLAQARKAFPEFFPDAHPVMRDTVSPGSFQRNYIGDGHPSLSAMAAGSGLPRAPVHNVSAADFTRGFLADGRAAAPSGEGRQATASTAVMGQAMNSMATLHDHVKLAYPDLCQLTVTHRDYTQGDGATGLSSAAGKFPAVPGAPGENATGLTGYSGKQRSTLQKARKKNRALRSALDKAGGMPDPEFSPYRGVPTLDGPVDRTSYIDKALQPAAGGDSAEYVEFLRGYLRSGDPRQRASAESVLKTIGADFTLPDDDDEEE